MTLHIYIHTHAHARAQAVKLGKPWVLDPVGCGATPYRTTVCTALLAASPTVVRGNGSEIIALARAAGCGADAAAAAAAAPKGVDSTASSGAALGAAKALALRFACVVAVSGATDLVSRAHGKDVVLCCLGGGETGAFRLPSSSPRPPHPHPLSIIPLQSKTKCKKKITDGTRVVAVDNGVELLTRVTAAGCSMTALIAAFLAAACSPPRAAAADGGGGASSAAPGALEATAAAMAVFGLAGERGLAAAPSPGPGSLRVGLLDALHLMGEAEVLAGVKVAELAA